MMNEAKMTELTQAEDMAYFRADLCLYSPESYSMDEKKEICNDMMSTSKAALNPMGSNRANVSWHSPSSKRFDQSAAPTRITSRYSISGSRRKH